MMYDPTAAILSSRSQRQLFNSALPDAPVVADRPRHPRQPRTPLFARIGGILRAGRTSPRVA